MKQFFLYLLVGVVNTFIGFGIIFLLTFLGVIPEIANLLGYLIGIICSFILNNFFTFNQKQVSSSNWWRFFFAMGVAYVINLVVLFVCYRILSFNVYFSQVLAGASYTLIGFVLSKIYVWRIKTP